MPVVSLEEVIRESLTNWHRLHWNLTLSWLPSFKSIKRILETTNLIEWPHLLHPFFKCLCVKLIELSLVLNILITGDYESRKRKEFDCLVCGGVVGDRKSQEFMDGCKSMVITLKCSSHSVCVLSLICSF